MAVSILGVSAFYHDSAAALVRDGEIVAAAQQERFSRRKHDPRFPFDAINYCLEEAFIEARELAAVIFYDNPVMTFDRVVKNALAAAPSGADAWVNASRSILGVKAHIAQYVQKALGCMPRLLLSDHHMAHAASAFLPSPFREAAILTVDGVGEWATTTIGHGRDDAIELLKDIRYPHSLGLLYSAATYFCGFKVNSGEYKLMGLAPYGRARYAKLIGDHLIDLKADGSFRLNMDYFGYADGTTMTNDAFHALFGGPPRQPESRITRREMDLAASVQVVLEEAMRRLARHAREITGAAKLVMAGGVALNCVANGKILADKIFDEVWIQPAAGDAGGALGAALLASSATFGIKRKIRPDGRDSLKGGYLGPRYSSAEIRAFLESRDYAYERSPDPSIRAQTIARAIADGKIVGYLSGRMEFGPRALGARSILGDPRDENTQSAMNLRIKKRESFRPFAPSVLHDETSDYFDLDRESPYMLFVAPVRGERRKPLSETGEGAGDDDMISVVRQARSDIPAVTHVDFSARIQTVHPADNPDFHAVLKAFKALTGYALLVNTSFNLRGEPIVRTPQDAYRCFMRTELDMLVLEDCLLWKNAQPEWREEKDWRSEFERD